MLADNCLLNYFNPNFETELICDASPYGLCAMLTQIDAETGAQKVISYASRSLTDVEKNYGQIEREALAILFGCYKFCLYLLTLLYLIYLLYLITL